MSIRDCHVIDYCLLCGDKIQTVLQLAPTPPANELLEEKHEQDVFPLNLVKCVECNHLQLDAVVSKERLYRHYLYCSDTSQSNRTYFENYANQMIDRFLPDTTCQVLDIASNDGLFLSYFQKQGFKARGIDPAENLAEAATIRGIPTMPEFFNEKSAKLLLDIHGKFRLITCNNAFAHNDDLRPILNGVKELLTDDGTFVVEVQYAMAMLKQKLFDVLYHEHAHSHHLTPLISFFAVNGLKIYDAEEVATGWGSLRIYACKAEAHFQPAERLADLKQYEYEEFDKLLEPFASTIETNKNELMKILNMLNIEGKTISVLGHPARAMTLAYYFGLNNGNIITDVFDDNVLKVGRYSPCTGRKIRPTSDIDIQKPDYLLILSWNYADELMKRFADYKSNGGQFIIPLPYIRLI